MPIPLRQNIKNISKVVELDGLPSNDREILIWWHCGFLKNRLDNSQPKALVAFREILNSGDLSDRVDYCRVPITVLGQVRVGTIWKNRQCQSEVIYDKNKFTVNFTENNWSITSFKQAVENGSLPPYPQEIYPLVYAKDHNWLLEFPIPTGGKLVVPCMEFFTRCYGRSAELRRVLSTYSWKECKEKRLYAPLEEPETPNQWKVRLRKRLVNGDVILLAHAKYEKYAENAVKSIYSQIEILHDPADKKPAFIKVYPWFQGLAELKVKGIWFDEGKSFLALQIVGCSQPGGIPIERDRENAKNSGQPTDIKKIGTAWAGAHESILVQAPEIIDLTGDVAPDPHAVSVEIEDPDFEELGVLRIITDRKKRPKGSSGPKVKGDDASIFSSGEAHGQGQGVGYAAIHAPQLMESQGILRDMWNAMMLLKEDKMMQIQAVEWFTFHDGYGDDAEPNLIGLEPFTIEERQENILDSTTIKWPYIDPVARKTRGVLVSRMTIQEASIYIIEIQRRTQKRKDKDERMKDVEESFKGLIVALDDQQEFEKWLWLFLSNIRFTKGVMKNLVEKCPGKAATFKHMAVGKSDNIRCKHNILNALHKIGFDITQ
jgi:hypothetical protein